MVVGSKKEFAGAPSNPPPTKININGEHQNPTSSQTVDGKQNSTSKPR